MTQNYLLTKLLESNSGMDLITELLDPETQKQLKAKPTFNHLQAKPETKRILERLDAEALNALEEELTYTDTIAELTGFKVGADLILTLLGLEPVYHVLPDKIDANI